MSHIHMVTGPKPHAHPVWLYWGIFFTLVILTGLTVFLAGYDFGKLSVVVTLLIAGTKSMFVLGFFMHLAYDSKFFAVVISSSLIFLSLLILFCVLDVDSRAEVDPQTANFLPRDEKVFKYAKENPESLPLRPKLQEPDPKALIYAKPGEH